jgi:hypothetical protein
MVWGLTIALYTYERLKFKKILLRNKKRGENMGRADTDRVDSIEIKSL